MKLDVMRVCRFSIAAALVSMTGVNATQASAIDPLGGRPSVLMAQGTVIPEPPHAAAPISESARVLVGHWRKTTIVFEQPEDEHLALHADGTVENWIVTASGRSAPTAGTWSVEGKMLNLLLEGHERISQPFTLYEGQLVFPNIANRRRFWENIGR
ncbi:MAG: hypothetical protein A4E19_19090 [Nitrospira sp. SG-bin1]|nr:MAG: hypothetical protein A4E19_19090 [Nitrospira sp. SG-bin1]